MMFTSINIMEAATFHTTRLQRNAYRNSFLQRRKIFNSKYPYSQSVKEKEKPCASFQEKAKEKKQEFKPVTHVMVDLDGTVIDSEDLSFTAACNYVKKFKKYYTMEIHGKIMGEKPMDAAKHVVEALNLPIEPAVYLHGLWQELVVTLPCTKELPGVTHLVDHLISCKIPTALVSSTSNNSYKLKARNHQPLLKKFCPVLLGGDRSDLKRGKPAPDIFLMALKLFPIVPSADKVLVIEDAPNGVKAAKAAGMQVVMVPHKNLPKNLIEESKPDLVISTLLDFKPELFKLPPFV